MEYDSQLPEYDDFLITAPLRRDNFEVGPQDEFTDLEHAIDHLRALQSTERYVQSFVERDLLHNRITEDQAIAKRAVARGKVEDAKLNIYSQVANLNRQAPVKRLVLLGQEAA